MDEEQMADALFAAVEKYVLKAVAPLQERIAELEARELPVAIKGDPGQDVDMELVTASVSEKVETLVSEHLAQIRQPEDGKSLTLEDIQPLLEANTDKWALDFERRAQGVLERAAERIPKPKDGRDALELEDFELTLGEDERTVTMSLRRGDVVVEKSIRFPTMKYMGVFHEKAAYERHDAVTYGGGIWIAKKDSPEGTPGLSEDFQLAVKRGRDGKESVSIPRDPNKPVQI